MFEMPLLRNKEFDFVPVRLELRNFDEVCELGCRLRLKWKFPYLEVLSSVLRNLIEGERELCALRLRDFLLQAGL